MKILSFLFIVTGMATMRADDSLLQNGDFSDGVAHWSGNAQSPAELTTDQPVPTDGIVIPLHDRDWTKIGQDFEVKPGTYQLHVALTFSPDIHFSNQIPDYCQIPPKLDFAPESDKSYDALLGQWLVVIADRDAATTLYWRIYPAKKSDPQSYTFTVKDINFSHRQSLILAFPPGKGFVALQHIFLVPDNTP